MPMARVIASDMTITEAHATVSHVGMRLAGLGHSVVPPRPRYCTANAASSRL